MFWQTIYLFRLVRVSVTSALLALGLIHQSLPGQRAAASSSNPVIAGDHPDPSIIRVGDTYWATSTSGDWSPQFPLFRSTDLHHWKAAGAIFPVQPDWAGESFWAPELVYDSGRVLAYYVGRKHNGPLCVAVATAQRPGGPYTDHGPVVCQPDGSIDPAFARDEAGKPFLIWKEDGNSERKPTPLWAQPLTDDLLHLTGEKTQLLTNEAASWEGGVVEAPYLLRHAGHFYLFYAGNACCGVECHYAEGVARADHLLGPYEKDPSNPVIRPNSTWKCPGHGSAVETAKGEDYFLYHAYAAAGSISLGRQSVLDRISWGEDGWPSINAGHGPTGTIHNLPPEPIRDDFHRSLIGPGWQWPVNHVPQMDLRNGELTLTDAKSGRPDFIARSIEWGAAATATVLVVEPGAARASLAVIASTAHSVGLGRRGTTLEVWRRDNLGPPVILWHQEAAKRSQIYLRVRFSQEGKQIAFSTSTDRKRWTPAGSTIDVSNLPQWDQGLRIGLMVEGAAGTKASFRSFALTP